MLGADAGVWKIEPGARLFLAPPTLLAPNMLLVECRWTDWNPISARLFPEDERWKMGCAGRPAARDILDPDWERPWFVNCPAACCMFETELARFMADEGIGIAEMLLFTAPRVCARVRIHKLQMQDARCARQYVPRAVGGPRRCPVPGPL
jgi:hypothetical protein